MAEVAQPLRTLQLVLEEHFNPGDQVTVIFGLPRPLTVPDVDSLFRHMDAQRLQWRILLGQTPAWQHAMQLQFQRPARSQGLSLQQQVEDVLHSAGVSDVLGFTIGESHSLNSFLPFAALAGAALVFFRLLRPAS